jgi:hypothetical protein
MPKPPQGALASWSDLPAAPSTEAGIDLESAGSGLPAAPKAVASGLPAAPRFSHTGVLYEVPGAKPAGSPVAAAGTSKPGQGAPDVEEDLLARMKRLQQM